MGMAIHTTDIQLFNALKQRRGETEAESLVGFIKTSVTQEVEARVPEIATKDFVRSQISESKAEIIKWMFVFVFSSTLVTLGGLLAIIKFFLK